MEKSKSESEREQRATARNVAVSSGLVETVDRYGSASAEYVKAYTGHDYETGKSLNRGHRDIAGYKVNSEFEEQNIKQQAGYSAEVKKTADDNAENIINRTEKRTVRTDDMPDEYGANNTQYDHVEVDECGNVIAGSESQMKFTGNYKHLLKKIAEGQGGGPKDLSRYQGVTLDLPSEQVEPAKEFCRSQAEKLHRQADALEAKGKTGLAAEKRGAAEHYEEIEKNIRDSGFDSEKAKEYRQNPKQATAKDILKTSHRAGLNGALIGAGIGGSVSIILNAIAYNQEDIELRDCLAKIVADTAKAAGVGYATAFTGSAAKSFMQQSKKEVLRNLSRTGLPSAIVTSCIEVSKAVSHYVRGQINAPEFFELIGEKGTGMLAGSFCAAVGQVAIPIPVIGGLIGGMVGFTISSTFYRSALQAFRDADAAEESYLGTKAKCEEARRAMAAYRADFEISFSMWFEESRIDMIRCLDRIDFATESKNLDEFTAATNAFAGCVGKNIQFRSQDEFNEFMNSKSPLVL